MPPRFAYWTILIDGKATAFRAHDRQELLPTFTQLKRTNPDVVIKWFGQGKLWESPEEQHAASRQPVSREKRGADWRPGGAHKDPRDRFKKKSRPERAWSETDPNLQRDHDRFAKRPKSDRPPSDKPAGGDGAVRPRSNDPRPGGGGWNNKPAGAPPRPNDRPWQTKPTGPRAQRKPWREKPAGGPPRGDDRLARRRSDNERPNGGGWQNKPGGPPRGDRPWSNKPAGAPRGDRPWNNKPGGPPRGDRPWNKKPAGGSGWSGKPRGDRPWGNKPPSAGGFKKKPFPPRNVPSGAPPAPRKRRDDEPTDS